MRSRRRGFTLIELLVVIAIIGILAAMVFPVFARARESARKSVCLSNVKNIALAINMYLADNNDTFPPHEQRQEVRVHWEVNCPCDGVQSSTGSNPGNCRATEANPYLRWPVILDEYTKNRDVWRCPSAIFEWSFGIYGNPDWFQEWLDNPGYQFCALFGCNQPFPNGWGGTITDTPAQATCASAAATGAFSQSIGANSNATGRKLNQLDDTVRYVVCGDVGMNINNANRTVRFAYPDICAVECAACLTPVSWEDDPSATWIAGDPRFQTDVAFRKEHARGRHLSGSNLGFADGHAKWMNAETILFGGVLAPGVTIIGSELEAKDPPELEGLMMCGFGAPGLRY